MSGLYFLGIKKSTIKKTPPFKYLFDWRDKQIYQKLINQIRTAHPLQELSSKEGSISYPVNNKDLTLYFRKFPASDIGVFNQVFLHHCYLPIINKVRESIPASAEIKIIDAGANVGYSCVYFKTWFPEAQIVAIEPEESNPRQLKKNMEINGLELNELVRGALWNKSAYLEVVRDFRDNREASFTVKEATKPTSIKGYGFEEILSSKGWEEIDLAKIDIEGSEGFLFDTNVNADAILSKTKFLAIEIHDEFNIRPVIYEHLKRNGFSYFEFDDLTLAINLKKLKD